MDTKFVVLCTLVCTVVGRDVILGKSTGRKIFDEIRQANPAIWRQIENVTIIAPSDEIISGVVVTDMRPEKDGDAQIVDGGEGQDRVTIELKSPTVLRGYEFHLEVYTESSTKYSDAEEHMPVPSENSDNNLAKMDDSTTISEGSGNGEHATVTATSVDNVSTELPKNSEKDSPASVSKDSDENIRPARETNDNGMSQASGSLDVDRMLLTITDVPVENSSNETPEESSTTELPEDAEEDNPLLIGQDSNFRPARETIDEDIEKTTEITDEASTTEVSEENITTELPETSDKDAPSFIGKDDNENIRPARRTEDEDDISESTDTLTVPSIIANEVGTTVEPDIEENVMTSTANEKTMTEEEITSAPLMYDNAKNIPDFPSLDILDLIKEKENTRRIRHTKDSEVTTESRNIEQTTTEMNENGESYDMTSENSVKSNVNDVVDLMPPEVSATYNTDFSNGESSRLTSNDGVSFVDVANDPTTTEAVSSESTEKEEETEVNNAETLTIEQLRNTRNASENNDIDSNNEIPKEAVPSYESDFANNNVIVLNRNFLSRDGAQTRYEVPIVLILANGAHLPTIKIIVEDSRPEEETPDLNIQPQATFEGNMNENDESPKNYSEADFMPSNDFMPPNEDFNPKPVVIM